MGFFDSLMDIGGKIVSAAAPVAAQFASGALSDLVRKRTAPRSSNMAGQMFMPGGFRAPGFAGGFFDPSGNVLSFPGNLTAGLPRVSLPQETNMATFLPAIMPGGALASAGGAITRAVARNLPGAVAGFGISELFGGGNGAVTSRSFYDAPFHTTARGSTVPSRIFTQGGEFFIHAGRPTAFSKASIKKRSARGACSMKRRRCRPR